MRILLLNWRDPLHPKSGGAEIVTMEHAKAWVTNGNTVDWLSMMYKSAKNQEVYEGVRIIRKGNALTIFIWSVIHYLFSGNTYDMVIDEIHGIPFFTPLYVRKPKIAFIHEVADTIWDYMYPFPLNKIGKFFESFYFLFYKNVPFWTDAESTLDDLGKKGIKKEHCIAIPCPTDIKALKSLPKKEKNPTFLFVSRLVKMKGIEEVLAAFSYIYSIEKKAKLWIIGGGDSTYVSSLQLWVNKNHLNNHVLFKGFVPRNEKIRLMKKAHLLLHASVKEGWGLVVIEAASQATPAVVYDVQGLRDTVKNGKTGIVLSKNTPEEMAKETLSLIRNKKMYKTYQKGALQWAKSLDWSTATQQSLALLVKYKLQ